MRSLNFPIKKQSVGIIHCPYKKKYRWKNVILKTCSNPKPHTELHINIIYKGDGHDRIRGFSLIVQIFIHF